MRRIWNDKRFWAAVTLAIVLGLWVAGVRIPPAILAAVQAIVQAMPETLTPDPAPVTTGEGSDSIDQTPTHLGFEKAAEPPDAGALSASAENWGQAPEAGASPQFPPTTGAP